MEDDLDLGTTIRDDLVPLALEYFLGVIEQGGDDDEDDMPEGDDDESDEDEKP